MNAPVTLPDWPADLLPPPFAAGERPALLDVLRPLVRSPQPGRDLVILLDGVGADLLQEHRALTPTLRRLEQGISRVRTVSPATTSSAMVSLHTGLSPLEHGVLGYLTYDPRTGTALNQISGAPGTDPRTWMPEASLVEAGTRRAVQVGPRKHAGSHLSGVAYRGWEFRGHGGGDRVQTVLGAMRAAGPDGLVHLHVDDVDHAGHRHGIDSEQWRSALAEVDGLLGTLLRRLPSGTRIQNVRTRNSTAVEAAAAAAMPAVVRPVDSASSTVPIPPGVGIAEPTAFPVRYTIARDVGARDCPKAASAAANAPRYPAVISRLPPRAIASRCG